MSKKVHRPVFEAMPVALKDIFNENYHADKVIERQLRLHKKWGSRDRRIFAESIYSIVRNWRKYWVQAGQEWKDFEEASLTDDLIYQLLYLEFTSNDIDWPHWLDVPKIPKLNLDFADKNSIPNWLNQLGEEQFQSQWPEVIEALNTQAHIYLRANTLKTTSRELVKKLSEENIEAEVINDVCVRLIKRANVFKTQSFKAGLFEVQDLGSQKIAEFVQAQPKDRVWDACAGAGGKSLYLSSLMQNKGKIIASDIHEWKLKELKKRAKRNSVDIIETRLIESKMIKRLMGKIDRLLLDVPCSGLGVLRRNPDTKWKMTPERIKELCELQKEILEKYSHIVKPGGVMVYATCSFLDVENISQVKAFLQEHPEWSLEESKSILPKDMDTDAFFMARLIRQS